MRGVQKIILSTEGALRLDPQTCLFWLPVVAASGAEAQRPIPPGVGLSVQTLVQRAKADGKLRVEQENSISQHLEERARSMGAGLWTQEYQKRWQAKLVNIFGGKDAIIKFFKVLHASPPLALSPPPFTVYLFTLKFRILCSSYRNCVILPWGWQGFPSRH